MNIVVDTNVFISALLKDSITREIIINSKDTLLFPEFEFEEIEKHRGELIKKSALSEKEFDTLLLRLLNYVRIIPINIILPFKNKAIEIMGKIDKDDVIFMASALAFNAVIWTEDKHFCKQHIVNILSTNDMIKNIN